MIQAVGCSILRPEIDMVLAELQREGLDIRVTYLDSALHMKPRQLREELKKQLEVTQKTETETHSSARPGEETDATRDRGDEASHITQPKLILFGDCCAGMAEFEQAGHVRVSVPNCMFWLLGRERYRTLIQEGAFFVQREWAERWKTVFQVELGLADEATTRLFFADMHRVLLYLDTGVGPVPEDKLREMSAYTGLPFHVESVSLDPLRQKLRQALERVPREAVTGFE
jgi:hypothetical protein